MSTTSPDQTQLEQIFFPDLLERSNSIQKNNTRFVHYTNAEAAMHILRSEQVWMRNSMCMSDFSEVHHGVHCLAKTYSATLEPVIKEVTPDLLQEIRDLLIGWEPYFLTETYLTCISEHDAAEDKYGRLSMWRAYAASTGVAIVLNSKPFFSNDESLKVIAAPVSYLDDGGFKKKLSKISENIREGASFIKKQPPQDIRDYIFHVLKVAVLTTKHPGFEEEREWRLIYTPKMTTSEHVQPEIRAVNNLVQTIYKIPLKEELGGIGIPNLIDRIIIGPTQYPYAVRQSFVELLKAAKISDAETKVLMSNIPLRT